jgi:hypothetical protein
MVSISQVVQFVLDLETISLPQSQLPISYRDSRDKTNHTRDPHFPVPAAGVSKHPDSIEPVVVITTKLPVLALWMIPMSVE